MIWRGAFDSPVGGFGMNLLLCFVCIDYAFTIVIAFDYFLSGCLLLLCYVGSYVIVSEGFMCVCYFAEWWVLCGMLFMCIDWYRYGFCEFPLGVC